MPSRKKNELKATGVPGIYLKPNKKLFVRATVTWSDGSRKERVKTMGRHATLDDAKEEKRLLVAELAAEDPRSISIAGPLPRTLDAYAEQWLVRRVEAEIIKPSVIERYTFTLAHYILPFFGDVTPNRVTRDDVLRWVAWVKELRQEDGSSYAKSTKEGWYRVLTCLLRDAKADYGLRVDPTERVRPNWKATAPTREQRTLTMDELQRYLKAARERVPTRYAEILFIALTGVRPGEMYALTWADVDLESGSFQISKAQWRQTVGTPKNGLGRVAVTEVRALCDALDDHRRRQIALGHLDGLVFPATNNGKPTSKMRSAQSLRKPMLRAAEWAGIDKRVGAQVLRCTVNTLLRRSGVDPETVRDVLGHVTESMTDLYMGQDEEAQRDAVKLFQAVAPNAEEDPTLH